ncbi:hypothetical protein BGY98DRAFT_411353 [Russula aff. rugulosa BPL654]|nr:hypothetical protein BGY98DRAFT_411353 [Russula aff. rugulosa BPL654]
MFHIVFSLTSRFLYLRNILQGLARGILALRSLDAISSHLTPALSPPPPLPLLEAPVPFLERPEQIISPYPSRDVIAIQRQFPVSASPFPIYQSSLIAITPSQFPNFCLFSSFLQSSLDSPSFCLKSPTFSRILPRRRLPSHTHQDILPSHSNTSLCSIAHPLACRLNSPLPSCLFLSFLCYFCGPDRLRLLPFSPSSGSCPFFSRMSQSQT